MNALYERANELPDKSLPPLPDNFEIPEDEPEAMWMKNDFTAPTPPGGMRRDYSERDWRIYRWFYARLTESVDAKIGTILTFPKESGLEEDKSIELGPQRGKEESTE